MVDQGYKCVMLAFLAKMGCEVGKGMLVPERRAGARAGTTWRRVMRRDRNPRSKAVEIQTGTGIYQGQGNHPESGRRSSPDLCRQPRGTTKVAGMRTSFSSRLHIKHRQTVCPEARRSVEILSRERSHSKKEVIS
jgi:hypothetical protein